MTDKPMTSVGAKNAHTQDVTVGDVREMYKLISVDHTENINKRRHEGEADSLEAARKMADIILNTRSNISMVEIINYNTGHVGERHVIPRQKIPVS